MISPSPGSALMIRMYDMQGKLVEIRVVHPAIAT